jgi:8-oxo-dGTP diphosphatase
MKPIDVVAAIINKENTYLIVQRNRDKYLGLKWEFPGGKIEVGELENEALIRELEEELNMKVEIIKHLGAFVHYYENFSLNLIGFKCNLIKWNGMMTDHDKAEWVLPEELVKYKFAEADLPFLDMIRNSEI